MANVFVVSEGRVRTPDIGTGARAGVVREWVMDRVKVTEALLTRADIDLGRGNVSDKQLAGDHACGFDWRASVARSAGKRTIGA